MSNDFIVALILGVVEGFTEFLPISSTGHLIVVNSFIGFRGEFADVFTIAIQSGAIFAVIVYFRKKLFSFRENKKETVDIWLKTAAGFIPAAAVGMLYGIELERLLFNPLVVGSALILGGIVLIILEERRWSNSIESINKLTIRKAFLIGVIQCISFIPGVSRSAATIIGAMILGCSRKTAAEYSFYLAIPTILGASIYALYKESTVLGLYELKILAAGFITSFITAYAVIALFINYISKNNFKIFGYYRILFGLIVFIYYLYYSGTPFNG